MAFTEPLNLNEILINKLAGGGNQAAIIFLFLAFIVIAILAARFKMPAITIIIVFGVFIIMMAGTLLGGSGILEGFLLLLIIGIVLSIASSLSRMFGG